jgi:hypothetical protein
MRQHCCPQPPSAAPLDMLKDSLSTVGLQSRLGSPAPPTDGCPRPRHPRIRTWICGSGHAPYATKHPCHGFRALRRRSSLPNLPFSVMVLDHSRHLLVQPVLKMHQSSWCASDVAAFEFFGGVPARLVPDSLKTGVTRPDLYDPKINKAYAELDAHYGCLIDPARANKPKDNPRVERPMQYVRDSFWRGREFTSLQQMQAAALIWCREVAGVRTSRALDGATDFEHYPPEKIAFTSPGSRSSRYSQFRVRLRRRPVRRFWEICWTRC